MNKSILAIVLIFTLISPTAMAASSNRGNIVRVGQDIVIQDGEVVSGNVVSVGGDITVHGQVQGSVVSVLGTTTVGSNGRVLGQLVSVDSSSGIRVGNNYGIPSIPGINQRSNWRHNYNFQGNRNTNSIFALFAGGGRLMVGVIMAILFVALFPTPVARVGDSIRSKPGQAIVIGLFTAVALTVLGFMLVITIIGIPLAIGLSIASWAAKQLGFAAIALIVGTTLLKGSDQQKFVQVVIGALLVGLVSIVPLAGWLAGIVMGWAALGAAVSTRFGTQEVT